FLYVSHPTPMWNVADAAVDRLMINVHDPKVDQLQTGVNRDDCMLLWVILVSVEHVREGCARQFVKQTSVLCPEPPLNARLVLRGTWGSILDAGPDLRAGQHEVLAVKMFGVVYHQRLRHTVSRPVMLDLWIIGLEI